MNLALTPYARHRAAQLPQNLLQWVMLLALLWVSLVASPFGLKPTSGQIDSLNTASGPTTLWQAASRLGLQASAQQSASAEPIAANSSIKTHRPISELLGEANAPFNESGITQGTRAWDKHSGRPGGTFPRLEGTTAEKNAIVNDWISGVLKNPQTTMKPLPRGGMEYRLPNGQGVVFEPGGKVNLLDPRWSK